MDAYDFIIKSIICNSGAYEVSNLPIGSYLCLATCAT